MWSELRPATRGLVERALQAASTGTPPVRNFHYDARADIDHHEDGGDGERGRQPADVPAGGAGRLSVPMSVPHALNI